MKIGSRVGAELVVVSHDPLRKRCVCQCSACGQTAVFGAEAVATGAARCVCAPLSAQERVALRTNQQALDAHRLAREWRPQR
jgi:hypothetical protein